MAMDNGPQTPADDAMKRDKWKNKLDFLLACVGFSVGLGNVWRFPYLCYKNGGGAFLIPYFLAVAIGGIPMFFQEVALGQFMNLGGIGVWNICPLFKGIGYATTTITFLLNVYYNVIMAWAFYYLFASFTTQLPWSHCGNEWNTPNCRSSYELAANDTNATSYNGGYESATYSYDVAINGNDVIINGRNITSHSIDLAVGADNATEMVRTDPVTEFWQLKVLSVSTGIQDVGHIKWELALCLLLAWVVVYLCVCKGIKSSGKVMYFTATAPYLLMTVLLIRGMTLPGAAEGLKFYLIPDWRRLADPKVWVDAGTQIFYSCSISLCTMHAIGSFNQWNHNSWRDSVLYTLVNSGTSLFAGFVIFPVLGFMAHEQGVTIDQVAEGGPGLAFIAYPKAVSQMPIAPLWSILFFFMIILLGLDSQFGLVEGVVTSIVDEYPRLLWRGRRKTLLTATVCFVSFLVGLTMVTNGGIYVFQLFDYYFTSWIRLIVTFVECMVVAWIYGVNRFYDNLQMMMGFRITPYMKVCWAVATPIFTMIIFGLCINSYSELTWNSTYHYPRWAILIGWLVASVSVTLIPVVMAVKVVKEKGTFMERIRKLLRPRLRAHQLRPQDDPKELIQDGNDVKMSEFVANGNHVTYLTSESSGDKKVDLNQPIDLPADIPPAKIEMNGGSPTDVV